MSKGLVSGTLSPDALAEMLAAIATLRKHLPFVAALSPVQRRGLLKLGTRSLEFVRKIRDVVKSNGDLVPKAMDVEEFLSDVALVDELDRLAPDLTSLSEAVEDTRMAAGSDAMSSAVQIYGVLAKAKRTVPGLDEIVRDLGVRFRRNRAAAPRATAEAASPQS